MIIVSVLLFSACTRQVPEPVDNNNTIENEETTVPNTGNEDTEEQEDIENQNDATHENNPALKLAWEGKVDGLDFQIGSLGSEIVEAWGMPDQYDYFLGGLYLQYEEQEIVFFTNGYIIDDEVDYGEVVIIGIFGHDKEIYNVKIGMTFKEIEAILGEPTSRNTPDENSDNELHHGMWTITYKSEKYTLVFQGSEENGPVSGANLRGK